MIEVTEVRNRRVDVEGRPVTRICVRSPRSSPISSIGCPRRDRPGGAQNRVGSPNPEVRSISSNRALVAMPPGAEKPCSPWSAASTR